MARKTNTDNNIFNFDIIEFFKTGKKIMLDKYEESCPLIVDGNVLYYSSNPIRQEKSIAIGIKSGKFIMINGDDDDLDDAEGTRDILQKYQDKEITTSFQCLKQAGLDLNKIKVINITKDLSRSLGCNSKGFKGFEKTVPQGATYKESRRGETNRLIEKSYHRAGSLLFEHNDVYYICSMDEDSYFCSELKTRPKTVDKAFRSLKPKRVLAYEKASGKQARRQGEWFFIPTKLKIEDMDENISLPLQKKGGNEHFAHSYKQIKGRHYCSDCVIHTEHLTIFFGNNIYEAIQNTAIGSWSVQGVD